MPSQLDPSSSSSRRRPFFRPRFLVGVFVALSALSVTYWNRAGLFERIRNAQVPEPERSQRQAFANQMELLQQRGDYALMRQAAAQWRRTHPTDPNGFASEGYAAYFMGDLDLSDAAWRRAAEIDPLLSNGADSWLESSQQVRAHWKGPLPALTLVESDLLQTEKLWQNRADSLLISGNYDAIEAKAAALLRSQQTQANGQWLLSTFFAALSDMPRARGVGAHDAQKDEAIWQDRLDALDTWHKARPASHLARLALANCWVSGAWLARGEGSSGSGGRQAEKLMEERLAPARKFLQVEASNTSLLPLYTSTFHLFSQLAGVQGPTYDAVVARDLKAFPTDSEAVFSKTIHLLPRWYGRRGEWEAFASQAADAVGGVGGDVLYARTIWRLQSLYGLAVWPGSGASWPRAKRGFETLLKRYPRSISASHAAFVLSNQAKDHSFSRQLLKDHIGGQVERGLWHDLGSFARARMATLREE